MRLIYVLCPWGLMFLITLSFPMFPFDLLENIRKPRLSDVSGGSKGSIGKKRVKDTMKV